MPYLEQGEFYSEFGNYAVSITVPETYTVAATGVLQNRSESGSKNHVERTGLTSPLRTAQKKQHGHLKKLADAQQSRATDTLQRTKTLVFAQEQVHDFAWVASKDYIIDSDTCRLPSGKMINVYACYTPDSRLRWKNSLTYLKAALRFYAAEVGEYPYATMTLAESAAAALGGMEYPALAILSAPPSEKTFDLLIAHETGHMWFYGTLATNERKAPWMDEGINTFYEKKYARQRYGESVKWEELLLQTNIKKKRDQPITTPAADFTPANYGLVAYYKTARWLAEVEKSLGTQPFREQMQAYYKQWQNKHPQHEDLRKFFAAGQRDTSLWAHIHTTGNLPGQQLSGFKVISPALPSTVKRYLQQPTRNILLASPALGYNYYDKLMIGALFTNYNLPPANLQYILLPLYATGSKKWNGIGHLQYAVYPSGVFPKIEAALSGMGFSKSLMPDSNGRMKYERFGKITPSIRLTLKQPLSSTKEKWVEARSFFISEQNFSKFVMASDGLMYVDSLAKERTVINQVTFSATNYRALYPFRYQLQLQQAKAFYRINITGNYFFNYANGGAGVRVFFSKFGYTTTNRLQRLGTTRYQPKLLGTTGEEDYTYSSYFLGRTASDANDASVVNNGGLAARQIMLRDGAFKLRIDAFDFLQGRSDNWVAAINLNTTFLPVKLPLKLFLDAGTFAEAWNGDENGNRIYYVAGLQASFIKEAINIFAPILYSKPYRDNLNSLPGQNTFLKKLTFNIDLNRVLLQQKSGNLFSL
jgi:hypothetical protein